ncbi:MAGE family-domain-containing protein [Lipomyces kononenkoae]|uniref:MAGE family-domain-containing protein n=1 Tax=Lipomyces kononenkoae TaxID=34357 RepID=A0ACC3T1C3_LIPKO
MPGRRRSRREISEDDNDDAFAYDSDAAQSRVQQRRRNRQEEDAPSARSAGSSNVEAADVSIVDNSRIDGSATDVVGDEIARMAKRLVRLALVGEQARNPLRRTTVNEKVLEASHRRDFAHVFWESQNLLTSILGMKLVELPTRSVPVRGTKKRGRLAKPPSSSSSKSYILTSTLPEPFRKLDVLKPRNQGDAVYNGIVTTVCSIILLSGGQITSAALMKHLRTLSIHKDTPLGGQSTEDVLKLMLKHLYLEREKEDDTMGLDTGDSVWTYSIGPRAMVELSEGAVIDFAVSVYGTHANNENLRERLTKALKEAKDALEDQKRMGAADITGEYQATLPSLTAKKTSKMPRSKKARMAALEQDDNSAAEDDDNNDDDEEDDEEDEDESGSGEEGSASDSGDDEDEDIDEEET